MAKSIELRIESPCSENWADMRPEERGRFCLSCSKTVVDFTGMSDREVLSWLAKSKGGLCGRFQETQLNRRLTAPAERKLNRFSYWNYLFAGVLLSSEVSAQSSQHSAQTTPALSATPAAGHSTPMLARRITNQRDGVDTESRDTLRGLLLDSSKNPITGATIMFTGKRGCISDTAGHFAIPRKLIDTDSITISSVGYETLKVDVSKTWGTIQNTVTSTVPIVLKFNPRILLGAVMITTRPKPSKQLSAVLKDTLSSLAFAKNALTIYPNPVVRGSSVTLALQAGEAETYAAQLFSLNGALINTIKIEGTEKSQTISMGIPPNLMPGMYFIRLSNPEMKKVYTRKLEIL